MTIPERMARLAVGLVLAAAACADPTETDAPVIEAVYLLDRVNGAAPPAPICAEGSAEQTLIYESIALRDDDSYGRLQQTRIDDGPVIEQSETGEFARTDSTILLINAAEDTLILAILDASFLRRIHPCGDSLRYESLD